MTSFYQRYMLEFVYDVLSDEAIFIITGCNKAGVNISDTHIHKYYYLPLSYITTI